MCLLEVAMCENAEAAISSWTVGVKSLRTEGRGNFTSGGVTDLGGHFYWGDQYPIICHAFDMTHTLSSVNKIES